MKNGKLIALVMALLMVLSTTALAEGVSVKISNVALEDAQGVRTEFLPVLTVETNGDNLSAAIEVDGESAKVNLGLDGDLLTGNFEGSANRYTFDPKALSGLLMADQTAVPFDYATVEDMTKAYVNLIAKSADKAYGEELNRKMMAAFNMESAAEPADIDVCGETYSLYKHTCTLHEDDLMAILNALREVDADFAAYFDAAENLAQQETNMTIEQSMTEMNSNLALEMTVWTTSADPAAQSDITRAEVLYTVDMEKRSYTDGEYPDDYAGEYAAESEETPEAQPVIVHMELPVTAEMVQDENGTRYDYYMDMEAEGSTMRLTLTCSDDLNGNASATGFVWFGADGSDEAFTLKAQYAQQQADDGWDGSAIVTVLSDPTGSVGEGALSFDLGVRPLPEREGEETALNTIDISGMDEQALQAIGIDASAFVLKASGILMRDPVLGALISQSMK